MQSRFAAVLTLMILVFCPSLSAMGKADAKFTTSFHMETDENENPKMTFQQLANGQARFFRRMPEFTTKDIVSFSPFPSEIGDGYGVVFRLKENAAKRLAAITNVNQGRWMIAQVNGRVVDGVLIDRQVDDGALVIWKGVTLEDVTLFDASLPRIGEEGKKKEKKKK
jgi:hypothetical protein